MGAFSPQIMPSNQAHWKNYLRSFCLNWYFSLGFGPIQFHGILNVTLMKHLYGGGEVK